MSLFAFVQLEFGFLLGPADGRYLLRDAPGEEARRIVALQTLGAPQRRLLGRRRARRVEEAPQPEPVPTSRATVIRARPFASEDDAAAWLEGLRRDAGALAAERDDAVRALNVVLRAHRVAATDPAARDVAVGQALVARAGYGSGEQVADGRFTAALELPPERTRRSREERLAPQERLAAILGARMEQLVCAELVLRARADIEAGRPREAALETRIALEAALAELPGTPGETGLGDLRGLREAVGQAANAALRGDPPEELRDAVRRAVEGLERALRRVRAAGPPPPPQEG